MGFVLNNSPWQRLARQASYPGTGNPNFWVPIGKSHKIFPKTLIVIPIDPKTLPKLCY